MLPQQGNQDRPVKYSSQTDCKMPKPKSLDLLFEELIIDHYWDSLNTEKELVIKHFTEGILPLAKSAILAHILEGMPPKREFENEVKGEWNDYERERHELFLDGYNQARQDIIEHLRRKMR